MSRLPIILLSLIAFPAPASGLAPTLGQTGSVIGIICLTMFVISYILLDYLVSIYLHLMLNG